MQPISDKVIKDGAQDWLVDDACYLNCSFEELIAEGSHFSGSLFVDCRFDRTDLYWCHAFNCHFVDCQFDRCDLRGNFDEVALIRCRFNECDYGKDNVGGVTKWKGAVALQCSVKGNPLPLAPADC